MSHDQQKHACILSAPSLCESFIRRGRTGAPTHLQRQFIFSLVSLFLVLCARLYLAPRPAFFAKHEDILGSRRYEGLKKKTKNINFISTWFRGLALL